MLFLITVLTIVTNYLRRSNYKGIGKHVIQFCVSVVVVLKARQILMVPVQVISGTCRTLAGWALHTTYLTMPFIGANLLIIDYCSILRTYY